MTQSKETIRARHRRYYVKNRERILKVTKKYQAENQEKIKEARQRYNKTKHEKSLFSLYGITTAEYDNMLEKQNGACKICGSIPNPTSFKKRLCVDHCHKTKKVRGLLCNRCNVCIGQFEDSTHLLKNAIQYLDST